MKRRYVSLVGAFVGFAALLCGPSAALAQAVLPPLDQFAELANAGVTAVGAVTVTGDVGSCPTAPGAQPPGMIVVPPGIYRPLGGDPVSCAAQATAAALRAFLAGLGPGLALNPQLNLNPPVPPGVYNVPASADIATTTTFTLNGPGTYVFLIPVSITQNTLSNVSLIGGADPCQVFWRLGTGAAVLQGFNFPGTVLANTAVTLDGAVNPVNIGANGIPGGRVVSITASVTHPGAFPKTVGGCFAAAPPPPPPPGGGVPALPHGMEWVLLVILVGTGAYILSRR